MQVLQYHADKTADGWLAIMYHLDTVGKGRAHVMQR